MLERIRSPRFIAGATILAIGAGVLTGCGGKDSTAPTAEKSEPAKKCDELFEADHDTSGITDVKVCIEGGKRIISTKIDGYASPLNTTTEACVGIDKKTLRVYEGVTSTATQSLLQQTPNHPICANGEVDSSDPLPAIRSN